MGKETALPGSPRPLACPPDRAPSSTPAVRILHFSDVHITAPLGGVPLRQMLNKRLVGAANLHLVRGRRFERGVYKLEALARLATEVAADLILCTGDYTALGTEPELALARQLMEPFTAAPLGFVTMPGNHDVYLPDAVRDRRFERHFGAFLESDLPDLCTDGPWPIVRLPADDVALVAVNSARPNPEPWLSSGRIPAIQLDGLARAIEDPRVAGRFVVVATHYAPRLRDGKPDTPRHGLDNAEQLLAACAPIERGILVHGHVHWRYHLRLPGLRVGLFGAGSATHAHREGLWVYDVGGPRPQARAGGWDGERFVLEPDANPARLRCGSDR